MLWIKRLVRWTLRAIAGFLMALFFLLIGFKGYLVWTAEGTDRSSTVSAVLVYVVGFVALTGICRLYEWATNEADE